MNTRQRVREALQTVAASALHIPLDTAKRLHDARSAIRQEVSDPDYGRMYFHPASGKVHWNVGDAAEFKTPHTHKGTFPSKFIEDTLRGHGFDDMEIGNEASPKKPEDGWVRVDSDVAESLAIGERRNPTDPLSDIPARIHHAERLQHLKAAAQNAEMKDWYPKHRERVTGYFDGDHQKAALFNLCLGVTSASTSVGTNWRKALHAMHNVVHNIPYTTGLASHDNAVNKVREGYHTGKSAREIAATLTSPKVGPYTRTLLGTETSGTNDMHVGEFYIGRAPENLSDHKRINQLRAKDGAALGWSQEQVQAAAWAANIARRGEKPTTYEDYAGRLANRFLLHRVKSSFKAGTPLLKTEFEGDERSVARRAKASGFVTEREMRDSDDGPDATQLGNALLVHMADDHSLSLPLKPPADVPVQDTPRDVTESLSTPCPVCDSLVALRARRGLSESVEEAKAVPFSADLHHGTRADFTAFSDHPADGVAHWLADDPEIAGLYAMRQSGEGDARVVKARVTLKNPLYITHDRYDAIRTSGNKAQRMQDLRTMATQRGHDGVVVPGEDVKLGKFSVRNPTIVAAFHGKSVQVTEGAETRKAPTPADQRMVDTIVNDPALPATAEKGMAYVVHWADGRGVFAVRSKSGLQAWLASVGDMAEIVSIKYQKPEWKGERLRTTESISRRDRYTPAEKADLHRILASLPKGHILPKILARMAGETVKHDLSAASPKLTIHRPKATVKESATTLTSPHDGSAHPAEMVDGELKHTHNSDGKLIHPTPEGRANFHRWFKGSNVVDTHGRPQVLYHGTRATFTAFDQGAQMHGSESGYGIYLTSSPTRASSYATGRGGEGGNVLPVYARSVKPFRSSPVADEPVADLAKEDAERITAVATKGVPRHEVPEELHGRVTTEFSSQIEAIRHYHKVTADWKARKGTGSTKPEVEMGDNGKYIVHHVDPETPAVSTKPWRAWRALYGAFGPAATHVLHDAGFDAHHAGTDTVVFHAHQIKSALGNTGAFSPHTDHIGEGSPASSPRYRMRGTTSAEKCEHCGMHLPSGKAVTVQRLDADGNDDPTAAPVTMGRRCAANHLAARTVRAGEVDRVVGAAEHERSQYSREAQVCASGAEEAAKRGVFGTGSPREATVDYRMRNQGALPASAWRKNGVHFGTIHTHPAFEAEMKAQGWERYQPWTPKTESLDRLRKMGAVDATGRNPRDAARAERELRARQRNVDPNAPTDRIENPKKSQPKTEGKAMYDLRPTLQGSAKDRDEATWDGATAVMRATTPWGDTPRVLAKITKRLDKRQTGL